VLQLTRFKMGAEETLVIKYIPMQIVANRDISEGCDRFGVVVSFLSGHLYKCLRY